MTKTLAWVSYKEPVSEDRIVAVQRTLGVKFPNRFVQCVREWNGGRPEPRCFPYFDTQRKRWNQGSFDALLDFRAPMDNYLKAIYRNDADLWRDMDIRPWWTIEDINILERPDHLTPELLAFAEDGGGNLICFDYRTGKDNSDPPIFFWHHELHADGEAPFAVAQNFDQLLELLGPCVNELAEIEARGRSVGQVHGT